MKITTNLKDNSPLLVDETGNNSGEHVDATGNDVDEPLDATGDNSGKPADATGDDVDEQVGNRRRRWQTCGCNQRCR